MLLDVQDVKATQDPPKQTLSGRASGRVLAIGCALLSASCGPIPVTRNNASNAPITNYTIGVLMTVSTGSPMIEWFGRAAYLPAFSMAMPVKPERIREPPSDPSLRWIARHLYTGQCPDGRYVVTSPAYFQGLIGFLVTADGRIPCAESVIEMRWKARRWSTPDLVGQAAFKPTTPEPVGANGLFKWELLYTGRTGTEVFAMYREYVNDLARPAFYQELRYDLTSSSRIVFRELEVDVVDASNSGITYKVLRDGSR